MPRISEMYAFVSEDDGPEDEGVVAFLDPTTGAWMPLIGADIHRVDSLRKMAQRISTATKKPIHLVRFLVREDMELIEP